MDASFSLVGEAGGVGGIEEGRETQEFFFFPFYDPQNSSRERTRGDYICRPTCLSGG